MLRDTDPNYFNGIITLVIGVVHILSADNQNKPLLFENPRTEFFLFE